MWNKLAVGTLGTCLCGLLLACAGLSGRGDAVAFNDGIAKANANCDGSVKTLVDRMAAAIKGNPADVAAFKKAIGDAKQTLASTRAQVKALKVLPKQSAKDFYDAELKYLDMREKNIADFDEMARVLENAQMNQFAKATKVQEIANRIEADEKKELTALQTAQSTFARDHNITILPK